MEICSAFLGLWTICGLLSALNPQLKSQTLVAFNSPVCLCDFGFNLYNAWTSGTEIIISTTASEICVHMTKQRKSCEISMGSSLYRGIYTKIALRIQLIPA